MMLKYVCPHSPLHPKRPLLFRICRQKVVCIRVELPVITVCKWILDAPASRIAQGARLPCQRRHVSPSEARLPLRRCVPATDLSPFMLSFGSISSFLIIIAGIQYQYYSFCLLVCCLLLFHFVETKKPTVGLVSHANAALVLWDLGHVLLKGARSDTCKPFHFQSVEAFGVFFFPQRAQSSLPPPCPQEDLEMDPNRNYKHQARAMLSPSGVWYFFFFN